MGKQVVDLDVLVAQVQAALQARAALSAAELRPLRRHLPALRPRLEALGLEVASNVRRPLAAQLLGALQAGFVPLKGIEKRVAGATPREVKAALQALVDEGRIREVVRAVGPGVMLASEAEGLVIDQSELGDLLRQLGNAQRLVKRALAKKGARSRPAILREDLTLLRFIQTEAPAPRGPVTAPRGAGIAARAGDAEAAALSQTIQARVAESARPLRVPELLRALGVGAEAGKRALLEGASAGLFGLEPESGMARLAPDDAAWCPEGPQGTRLAWIVAREQRRGS